MNICLNGLFLVTDLLSCCFLFVVFQWFSHLGTGKVLTVRDLLSWVDFMNATEEILGAKNAFCHGLFLVLLNGLSLGAFLVQLYLVRSTFYFFILVSG